MDDVREARQRAAADQTLRSRHVPDTEHLRAADGDDGPLLSGYGSLTDTPYEMRDFFGPYIEVVASGAFAKTINDKREAAEDDIKSMFNHDVSFLLGRTNNGTLTLAEDDTGLRYDVDINESDPAAMGVHARVARGDVTGSSFWFRIIRADWRFAADNDDLELDEFTIREVELFETGPVVFPASLSTTAEARAIERVVSASGVPEAQRARVVSQMLSDPDAAEQFVRDAFTNLPDLRDKACSRNGDPAASQAPDDEPPDGHSGIARQKTIDLAIRAGLTTKEMNA